MHTYIQKPFMVAVMFLGLSLVVGKTLLLFGPAFPVIGDSLKYIAIADSIVNGSYLAIEGIIYPPGYSTFLAVIYTLLGTDEQLIYAVHFIFLSGIAFLTYLIARRFFSIPNALAMLLGVGIIFWPYMLLYSLLVMSEIVFITGFLLILYLTLSILKKSTNKNFLVLGIVFGVTTLVRPVTLLLPFWLIAIYSLICLYQRTEILPRKQLLLGIAAFILTLAPWSTYLYLQTGNILPVSSHLPHVLEKSYSLEYEGAVSEEGPSISEIATSKAKNLILFWNPGAGGYQAEQVTERFPAATYGIWVYKISFLVILGLAFLSLKTRPLSPALICVWSFVLYVWLLHAALFPYPRYMLPLIPLLFILAAHVITPYTVRYLGNK